jgi:cyanophycin synthetase
VLAAPGDRRDEDIREIARIAARGADHIIVRRDDDLRGRQDREVPELLASELQSAGFDPARIEIVPDEQDAVGKALALASRGDLLLIFGDKVSRCWKQITKFHDDHAAATASQVGGLVETMEVTSVGTLPPSPPANSATRDAAVSPLGRLDLVQDERGVRIAREAED